MSSGPVSEIYRDSRGNEIALYADAPDQWGMGQSRCPGYPGISR